MTVTLPSPKTLCLRGKQCVAQVRMAQGDLVRRCQRASATPHPKALKQIETLKATLAQLRATLADHIAHCSECTVEEES